MLTDAKVKTLKPSEKLYRILDADRLYIEVRPTGKKIWRLKYTLNKKEGSVSFGEYPAVSLVEARKFRDQAKAMLAKGLDPAAERRKEKELRISEANNTFKAIAKEYTEKRLSNKSPDYLKQFESCLTRDVYKYIGEKNIREITSADVLHITDMTMKRIQQESPHATGEMAAIQNQTYIGSVMRYAIATLRADYDPTYAVRGSIGRPEVNHARPLSKKEVIHLRNGLKNYGGTTTVKNAGLMLLYSMLRAVEVRRMKWEWVDFDEMTITFPKDAMKKKRIHIVPITNQILDILYEQRELQKPCGHVFPAVQNEGMLARTTLNRMLVYVGMTDVTTHDLRATASTYLNEGDYNDKWIERQLAHADQNKTRASYNHAKHLSSRRKMLQDWDDMVDSWMA